MNYKRGVFNITAGICWIIAGLIHAIAFISGSVNMVYAGDGLSSLMVVFGILSSIMMIISGITIMMGEIRVMMATSLALGIELTILSLIFCSVLIHGLIVLLMLAFVAFAVSFFLLAVAARRTKNDDAIGTTWIGAIVAYGAGILLILITAFSLAGISGLSRYLGGIVTGRIIGSLFLICGPTISAIIFTGIDMNKSQNDGYYTVSYFRHNYNYNYVRRTPNVSSPYDYRPVNEPVNYIYQPAPVNYYPQNYYRPARPQRVNSYRPAQPRQYYGNGQAQPRYNYPVARPRRVNNYRPARSGNYYGYPQPRSGNNLIAMPTPVRKLG